MCVLGVKKKRSDLFVKKIAPREFVESRPMINQSRIYELSISPTALKGWLSLLRWN